MNDRLTSQFERFRENNDLRALARLFDEVAPELASVAAHMARSSDEAEDLIQATFLSAIERAESFDRSRPVVPWLLGILVVHARRQRERAGREVDVERLRQPGESDPEREAEQREIVSAVGSAVEQLGANYAPLVRRYLIDGATSESLAQEFELSPITARVRLHRGLRQLRKLLPVGLSVAAFGVAARHLDLASIRATLLKRAAEITGAPLPVASVASAALVLALLAPVAVALPAWLWWRTPEFKEAALVELATSPTAGEASLESTSAAIPRALAETSAPEPEPAAVSAPASLSDGQAHIRGRLLRPDGAPAAGVTGHRT